MKKALRAEILAVGTELLLGNIANTDARDVSVMMSELGINVFYHTVVGDNPERLTDAVNIARSRADIIITTGGLGPTCDDLTKVVLAKAFGKELVFHEESAERIRAFFRQRTPGREMTENNLQQAYLPEGCTVFVNDWGTAPGCAFESDGVTVIMLPGPPSECVPMFRHRAMPYLAAKSDETIRSHNLRIFGMGESAVEDKLRDRMNELTNPTLAPYAKEGEVMLRVTAKAKNEAEAEEMMRPVVDEVCGILGDIVYGVDVESLEERVFNLLKEKNLVFAAAESCTGGLIAKRITDLAGASEVFRGGVTVYTNDAKMHLLGVPAEMLETHGAVSESVARALAERVREVLGADFGIGVTGLAGPDGDGVHPVGTVFVALAAEEETFVRALSLGKGSRARLRTAAANHALDMLRRYLENKPVV